MTLLSVDGLTISAGASPLVSNLSFDIARGGRMGLIGESGSGKSLTALAVTGLLSRAMSIRGSVVLGGQQVVGADERTLARQRGVSSAVIFQEPMTALDPLMRLGRQVEEPLRRRYHRAGLATHTIKRDVLELLERVALPNPERIARAYPHEVSGGQRQRVAIAMALACRPQLLIADEPTTALDVTTQAEILRLVDELVRELGMALLFISHDLAVVGNVVDEVTVLRQGVAVEQGPVSQILRHPTQPYTQSLVQAARALDDALRGAR